MNMQTKTMGTHLASHSHLRDDHCNAILYSIQCKTVRELGTTQRLVSTVRGRAVGKAPGTLTDPDVYFEALTLTGYRDKTCMNNCMWLGRIGVAERQPQWPRAAMPK